MPAWRLVEILPTWRSAEVCKIKFAHIVHRCHALLVGFCAAFIVVPVYIGRGRLGGGVLEAYVAKQINLIEWFCGSGTEFGLTPYGRERRGDRPVEVADECRVYGTLDP